MKRKRFTEAQIVGFLKEAEAGVSIGDVCRKHGIGESTFYQWRSKYSGMDVSMLMQLKALQKENQRLKRMYADACMDRDLLKEVVEKKV